MDIYVKDNKLRATLEDEATLKRRYGTEMMKKVNIRIAALRAAETLADFWPPLSGPERCHELKGDLSGTFSIDVKQPYRLLFTPVETNAAKDRSDEQKRWKSITAIEILGIEDTHG